MKNRLGYDLRICVESICKGVSREISHAKILAKEVFENEEEFRAYFCLRVDSPAMRIIFEK